MSDETISRYPIRGQAHHKPAPTILSLLGAGAALYVQREPENQYDTNAIQVWIKEIPEDFKEILQSSCEEDGIELPNLSSPFMLCYVGKEYAAALAPTMDQGNMTTLPARLAFTADGKYAVEIGGEQEEAMEEEEEEGINVLEDIDEDDYIEDDDFEDDEGEG